MIRDHSGKALMILDGRMAFVWMLILAAITSLPSAYSFATVTQATRRIHSVAFLDAATTAPQRSIDYSIQQRKYTTKLYSEDDANEDLPTFSDSDSTLLGAVGVVASIIMVYSESVLFRTGCGLPAGPFGLVGAAEGVSYLGVVVLVGYSLFTKIRTGTGLPSGPGGVLGAAEGLSYLALLAGIFVLFAQVTNYGYIPNAVPMDGGMCK